MRAVVQRVSKASVTVAEETVGRIEGGLLVLLAVSVEDDASDVAWMSRKLANLRIFPDAEGRMNRSLTQEGGKLLLVSQFTLYGDCRKGNRPSFIRSAPPEKARELYESLASLLCREGIEVETGVFRASMDVSSVNRGPVTLVLDSRDRI